MGDSEIYDSGLIGAMEPEVMLWVELSALSFQPSAFSSCGVGFGLAPGPARKARVSRLTACKKYRAGEFGSRIPRPG